MEGPIGDMGYLSIWPIDEIVELNQEYAVDEFYPELNILVQMVQTLHMVLSLIKYEILII